MQLFFGGYLDHILSHSMKNIFVAISPIQNRSLIGLTGNVRNYYHKDKPLHASFADRQILILTIVVWYADINWCLRAAPWQNSWIS